jgi:Flp pilus assembly protein TadD
MLAADPSNLRAFLGLAAAYDQAGDSDKAIATARRAYEMALAQHDTIVAAQSLQLLDIMTPKSPTINPHPNR